jgi:DNA-binding transcriptional LysR family regulator
MELTHIKYFLEVARTEHVTQSAKNLCIVQPALTHAIHKLEDELGVKLFKTSGRNIKLTEYGMHFLSRVQPLYEEIERLPQELRSMASDDSVKIRLNVLAASSLITSAVIAYKRLHPEINFDLTQNESSSLYDVGVFTYADAGKVKPDDDEVARFDEEIFLAVPNMEQYRKVDRISLRQMEGEKFIGLAGTKQLRSICNEFCRGLGVRTDISFESDNTSAIKDAVAAGIGVCFWPEFTWGRVERRKIRLLRIVDAPFRRDLLVTLRRNKADNRNTENFYRFLVAYLRKHFRRHR